MSDIKKVRSSRDGDVFHYYWAARRCLQLIPFNSKLNSISIEGSSTLESNVDSSIKEGDEVIDVAEYYDGSSFEIASKVVYIQLKHSTREPNKDFTASGIWHTVESFSKRFEEYLQKYNEDECLKKLKFKFVTNRPISEKILQTVIDAKNQTSPSYPKEFSKLENMTGFKGERLTKFCEILEIKGKQPNFIQQKQLLLNSFSNELPGLQEASPILLKNLVHEKALSISEENNIIQRNDVLRVLNTNTEKLLPAPSKISLPVNVFERDQTLEIIKKIESIDSGMIIIEADGGVGKTILSMQLYEKISKSHNVLFDCFANGEYRSTSKHRHTCQTAIVQIINELAIKGLCDLIIPSVNATSTDYLKLFIQRLHQSINSIRNQNKKSGINIIIDAADNAQMASEDFNGTDSFAKLLLKEPIPEGVKIIYTSRDYRVSKLDPPPNYTQLKLRPFSENETKIHLCQYYEKLNKTDIEEFHKITSANPRIQSRMLSLEDPFQKMMIRIGSRPLSIEDTLQKLFQQSLKKVIYESGKIESGSLESICKALSVLRPRIPIDVLSKITRVTTSAIKSFATDVGSPLMVIDNTLQFYDEPAETWFRENYYPEINELKEYINVLKPYAKQSAYISGLLPSLMLKANEYDQLISIALESEHLPDTEIEKREIEYQRFQFAFKASLRLKKYKNAAMLCYKASNVMLGKERQLYLFSENTDLVSEFFGDNEILDFFSNNEFEDNWFGSRFVFESAILSGKKGLKSDAQSKYRVAKDFLSGFLRNRNKNNRDESIKDYEIAEIIYTVLNLYGTKYAAISLRKWIPRKISFSIGNIISEKLISHNRIEELIELSLHAGNDIGLVLAVNNHLSSIGKLLPKECINRVFKIVSSTLVNFKGMFSSDYKSTVLKTIISLIQSVILHSIEDIPKCIDLLKRYIPKRYSGLTTSHSESRIPLLQAYALLKVLKNNLKEISTFNIEEFLNEEVKKDSHKYRQIKNYTKQLSPICQQWTNSLINKNKYSKSSEWFSTLLIKVNKLRNGYPRTNQDSEIVGLLQKIMALQTENIADLTQLFFSWYNDSNVYCSTPKIIEYIYLFSQDENLHELAIKFLKIAYKLTVSERDDAQYTAEYILKLARAILPVSKEESKYYFNEAIKFTENIGAENYTRWSSILSFAEKAALEDKNHDEITYKLARCGELVRSYVYRDKHFQWTDTTKTMTKLSPHSALTILSRWRDRKFGIGRNLLVDVVETIISENKIDNKLLLPFIAYKYNWNFAQLYDLALESNHTTSSKQKFSDCLVEYYKLAIKSSDIWDSIHESSIRHSVNIENLDEIKRHAKKKSIEGDPSSNEITKVCADTFLGLDFCESSDIQIGFERYKEKYDSNHFGSFISAIFVFISVNKRICFLDSVFKVQDFTVYGSAQLIINVPDQWLDQQSVKQKLREIYLRVIEQNHFSIFFHREYDYLHIKEVCAKLNIKKSQIVEIILSATANSPELLSSERFFELAGLLSLENSPCESNEVLELALSQFDELLEDDDGDGHWRQELMPLETIDAAVSGYIFSGMSHPTPEQRWESSHAFCLACSLGISTITENILKFIKTDQTLPFNHPGFVNYNYYAKTWLLFSLLRMSNKDPKSILIYKEFIKDHSKPENKHILIRYLSILALAQLNSKNYINPKLQENHEIFNLFHISKNSVNLSHSTSENTDLYFGIDFEPYWFSPLADCFCINEKDVTVIVEKVVKSNLLGITNPNQDIRAEKGHFDERSHHSHGSYPTDDNLNFYVTLNSLMIAASLLIEKYKDSLDESQFLNWIRGHGVTSKDGNWLFDLRQPKLVTNSKWLESGENDLSSDSKGKDWFDKLFNIDSNQLPIWAMLQSYNEDRDERVSIRSALVSKITSKALVRALSTALDHRDYQIPNYSARLEINHDDYKLIGWVCSSDKDIELDKNDPWGARIDFPLYSPSNEIVKEFELKPIDKNRKWKNLSGDTVFKSIVWADNPMTDDPYLRDSGRKLFISKKYLLNYLKKSEFDLIVEVTINRGIKKYSYDYKREKFNSLPVSVKVFSIDENGEIYE